MRDLDNEMIRKDRMRYIKNKMSSNLCLLAILLDVFYFVSIYKSDVSTYYYNILIGASIVYNLLFMLLAFLSSEGVKEYNERYSYIMVVLGVLQFVRIFIIPVRAHHATATVQSVERIVMENGQFTRCLVYLILSGLCLLVGAYVGIVRSRTLHSYIATLGEEKRRD